MMTSSNGNIFRVTGHLCGEFTGQRWILHTKASDASLWVWINGWVKNREADDLRRYRVHCDIIVMQDFDFVSSLHTYCSLSTDLRRDDAHDFLSYLLGNFGHLVGI